MRSFCPLAADRGRRAGNLASLLRPLPDSLHFYYAAQGNSVVDILRIVYAGHAISCSSAQLATFDGEPQELFFSDAGLAAVEPASGRRLWNFDAPQNGIWRVVQPRQCDDGTVLIGCEDLGLVRMEIARQNDGWSVAPRWKSRAIRPAYSDFVISGDSLYGFDESFSSPPTPPSTKSSPGSRLLAARPGTTPVIAHGQLDVRNDHELVCYELPPTAGPEAGL